MSENEKTIYTEIQLLPDNVPAFLQFLETVDWSNYPGVSLIHTLINNEGDGSESEETPLIKEGNYAYLGLTFNGNFDYREIDKFIDKVWQKKLIERVLFDAVGLDTESMDLTEKQTSVLKMKLDDSLRELLLQQSHEYSRVYGNAHNEIKSGVSNSFLEQMYGLISFGKRLGLIDPEIHPSDYLKTL